jgi:hypothetical protein
LVQALEIAAWLEADLIRIIPDQRKGPLSPAKLKTLASSEAGKPNREIGFFVSHSSKDKDVAKRISEGIRALGLKVFFDAWSIDASDSIVQKISESIVSHDTVVVLLTPNSVESKWVKLELDTALMAQLAGHDIRVLPLLMLPCQLPPVLTSIKYIDFTSSFEDGFIELIQYVKRRKARVEEQRGQ